MANSPVSKEALDEQFLAVYGELRKVARAMLRFREDGTLAPTAVVHEAYGRMALAKSLPEVTEQSFKRIAARVMRQVLCDAARGRMALKRGGSQAAQVPLHIDELPSSTLSVERILLVNDFLDRLQLLSPRQASVVELLFFGGLTVSETAEELGISSKTAERDWRSARAWLSREANSLDGS